MTHLNLTLLRRKRTWAEILLIGILAATGIALWPTAQCALGACAPRDAWCNADCSQTCGQTNSLREIDPGNGGWGHVAERDGGLVCVRNPNGFREYGYNCNETDNCNFTAWGAGVAGKTVIRRNGNVYASQLDTRPPSPNAAPGTPCVPRIRQAQLQCCNGGGGSDGGGGCTPQYAPPAITLGGHTPAYPLVIGQDPDDVGVDVTVVIEGGQKTNGCNRGPAQRNITGVSPVSVMLSDASKEWIQNELALYYPGAQVLDTYPLLPPYAVNGIGTTTVTVTFHFDPLDPGNYDIQVTATQDDGQSKTETLQVPAYLLESTIIQ